MNKDILEGHWKEMRGSAKQWWGKLTYDDLNRIAGKRDQLVGALRTRYGYSRPQAGEEIDRRLKEYDQETEPVRVTLESGTCASPLAGKTLDQRSK
jgi:uncharacterized protein YjbJ (UPF0337 family)